MLSGYRAAIITSFAKSVKLYHSAGLNYGLVSMLRWKPIGEGQTTYRPSVFSQGTTKWLTSAPDQPDFLKASSNAFQPLIGLSMLVILCTFTHTC